MASASPPLASGSGVLRDKAPEFRDPSPPGYWKPRDPELIVGATIKPNDADEGEKKKAEITGTLIEEPQYLKRRKTFKRWVLRQKDGHRVPLTANLSLMFALQQASPASGPVTLHGTWLQSKANEGLKYFSVERIQTAVPEPASSSVQVDEGSNAPSENEADMSESDREPASAEASEEDEESSVADDNGSTTKIAGEGATEIVATDNSAKTMKAGEMSGVATRTLSIDTKSVDLPLIDTPSTGSGVR